jgi:hypothetical protein
MTGHRFAGRALLLTAAAVATIALPSHGQRAGDGFLFHAPSGSWTFRGGVQTATGHSDIFADVTDQLTVDRSDFNSPTFGTTFAMSVSARNDIVLDISYATVSRTSEFRDWVDNNDQPIQQETSLRRIPITLGLRHYITSRGRPIGEFAWIPARRALYAAVGAGMMEYKFHQVGDFIDFQTLNVFHDEFVSQAWTPVVHAALGLDLALGSFTMVTTEGRYTYARAPMSADFVGYNNIDLSGLSVTVGLTFRLY